MQIRKLLCGAAMMVASYLGAQESVHQNVALTSTGGIARFAPVRVCQYPANATPCTNLATLFTDRTGATTTPNPFNADSSGNFQFWAAPNFYEVQVTLAGQTAPYKDYVAILGSDPLNPSFTTATAAADPTQNLQLATKHYVDTHGGNVGGHVTANQGAGVDGNGALSPLPEVSLSTTAGVTSFLCQEDHSAGIYDARCPAYGGIYGTLTQQIAAANALFNQVGCDIFHGLGGAEIRYPQGTFAWDQAQVPPGVWLHGLPNSLGGTTIQDAYYGRQVGWAPPSVTVTCSDGTHTISGANTKVTNLTFHGCATGSCVDAPAGLSRATIYSNSSSLLDNGFDMQATGGMVQDVFTFQFGGFGLRVSGQDTKLYHCRGSADISAYYFGGYNGAGDTTGPGNTAWHGGHELVGQDIVVDGDEVYSYFDSPTTGTYQHLATILVGGGIGYFDHLWAQLGMVGIVEPGPLGDHATIVNAKVDFSRTYGIWSDSVGTIIRHAVIDGACTAGNAASINTTGQFAGTCESMALVTPGADVSDVAGFNNGGFGTSQATAQFFVAFGKTHNLSGTFEYVTTGPTYGGNQNWEPQNPGIVGIVATSPNVDLLQWVSPTDSSAATYTSFNHVMQNQDFYLQGGNTNVTINNNPPFIVLCAGSNVSLSSVKGFMHFRATAGDAFGQPGHVTQVCGV